MTVRQNLYLDLEIVTALDALAAGNRGNKSRLVNDALAGWLANKGMKEVDYLLKPRFDQIARDLALVRRDIEVVHESLALFVRYQLMVTAPLPEADTVAMAVGRERFAAFLVQVGRHLKSGIRTFGGLVGDPQ